MTLFFGRPRERTLRAPALCAVVLLATGSLGAQQSKVRHNEVRPRSASASGSSVPGPPPAVPAAPAAPVAPPGPVTPAAPVTPPVPSAPAAPSVPSAPTGASASPGSPVDGATTGTAVVPPPVPGPPPAERPAPPTPSADAAAPPASPASEAVPVEPVVKDQAPPAPRTRHNEVRDPRGASRATPPRFASETGEWVYTNDYGWIWIPKDVSVVSANDNPYVYLYTPYFGWSWYVSPWGYGPYSCGDWAFRSAIGLAFWANHRGDSISHHGHRAPQGQGSAPRPGRGESSPGSDRGGSRMPSAGSSPKSGRGR